MTNLDESSEHVQITSKKLSNDEFDADYCPKNPHNQDIAKKRHLTYNPRSQCYEDNDGCLIRDKFGQPL